MKQSRFQHIYPPTNRLFFDGGKNNKYERSIIQDNESPDCLNVEFGAGSVASREGCQKLNTAAIGSFVGDGLYTRRADDGSETMVAFAGGTMYTLGTTTFTAIASGTSIWTAGVRVGAVQYENYLFAGNGYVLPYKWNGTAFTRHGIYPPSTAVTATSNGTGLVTGTVQYKITAVNSNLVESDVGPASTAFIVSGAATVRLSAIQTFFASFGVSARRIYRSNSGTVYKRVATISDNTTTTYDDNIADLSLGANAPTDNGVPPLYSIACFHADRLFVNDLLNPNQVWYSELGNPYTFASTNFIRVGDNTSDLVKTISIYNGALLIGCEKSPHIVYMPTVDPATWSPPQRLQVAFGSRSPFGVVSFLDKILVPAIDQSGKFVGLSAIKGNAVDPTSSLLTFSATGSELKSDRIEPDMFQVQEAYVGNISSISYKNRLYIALTYGSGNTTNNRIYLMDYSIADLSKSQKESWTPWTGLNAAQFTIYSGKIYYISSTPTGFVYQLQTGVYNDDGAAINAYFWTKEFSGDKSEINYTKDFRYANFLCEMTGNYNMDVFYRVDSDVGDGNVQRVPLNPGGTNWGEFKWGQANWGGGVTQKDRRVFLGGARGTRIQFKFSNQNVVNQRFKIHWGMFYYNMKGYR